MHSDARRELTTYFTLLNCFGPQSDVLSRLTRITLDGKWLHPSVIFGLGRHENLKILNLKMNTADPIDMTEWEDRNSVDRMITHYEIDQVLIIDI